MFVGSLRIKLHLPWVRSLKDKRMEVKSLTTRLRNRFGVAVAEVDLQDIHRSAVLGVACVCTSATGCEELLDNIAGWVQGNTEGELVEAEREIRPA